MPERVEPPGTSRDKPTPTAPPAASQYSPPATDIAPPPTAQAREQARARPLRSLRRAGERFQNISSMERALSLIGGGLLALYGLRRRHLWTVLPLTGLGGVLAYRGATGYSRAYRRIGIERPLGPIEMVEAVTVNRAVEDVYAYWRRLENLPTFMRHLESVVELDARRSHWAAQAMGARVIEWDAEIVEDKPNELLRWHSLPDSVVQHGGEVRFRRAPGGRGTEVHVRIDYRPPIGFAIAALMYPVNRQMLKEDIRRFKRMLEVGELPTTEGQPSARRRPMLRPEGDRQ